MSVHREGGQVPQILEGACSMWVGKACERESQVGWNLRQAGITGGLESQAGWNQWQVGVTGGLKLQAGWKRRWVRSALP